LFNAGVGEPYKFLVCQGLESANSHWFVNRRQLKRSTGNNNRPARWRSSYKRKLARKL
jgi:hypothetical protein